MQTREEARIFVKELDLSVTVMLLEDTPAVLSLGKLFEDHGNNHHWTSGQKPQLIKDGRRIQCSTENYAPIVVPGLSTSFFYNTHTYFFNTFIKDSVFDDRRYAENPVPERSGNMSEELRENPLQTSTETENHK